jgi:hypothetical protein
VLTSVLFALSPELSPCSREKEKMYKDCVSHLHNCKVSPPGIAPFISHIRHIFIILTGWAEEKWNGEKKIQLLFVGEMEGDLD